MTPPLTLPMLSLAVLAYTDEQPKPGETIQAQKARMRADIDAALVTEVPGWSVVWGPALSSDRANMMYAAGNAATNEYAISIRGTDVKYLINAYQDVAVRKLMPFTEFGSTVTASIACGTNEAFGVLRGMTGTSSSGTVTLAAFVSALPSAASVYVTGHSLGGCLASVVGPWVVALRGGAGTNGVYTFAAPTAGDAGFATAYNNLYLNADGSSRAFRFYNTLDVVPNAWATLDTIKTYYSPAPSCPDVMKAAIDCVKRTIEPYVQPGSPANGSAISLPGTVQTASGWLDAQAFLNEIEIQHTGSTYQALLGGARYSSTLLTLASAVAAAAPSA